MPGLRGYVERPVGVKVNYIDIDGNNKSIELSGFGATVMQHELDHLEGKLYVDHVKDITKLSYMEEYVEFHDQEEE